MSRPRPARAASPRRPAPEPVPAPARASARERLAVTALLALHLAFVTWGAVRNSVTFDENFHVPAGALIVAARNYTASRAQPPLIKSLCALPVLALGARPPSREAVLSEDEFTVGESFMRNNADRYQELFVAARLVVACLSLLLGLLVWSFARRLFGAGAGLLALGLYAFAPEALAHAGIAGMDLGTGLTTAAVIVAFWHFCRTGSWRSWLWLALATGAAFLTRFSAFQLGPMLLVLATIGTALRRLARPGRVWLGLVLLVPVVWLALAVGYAGQLWTGPLSGLPFRSTAFQHLKQALPGLRLFLPLPYLSGLDYVALFSQPGATHTFLLGRVHEGGVWYYFPLALLFKWPLGFLGALALALAASLGRRDVRTDRWDEAFLLVPVALTLGMAMTSTLGVGIRYVFPVLPLLCVWMGGLAGSRPAAKRPSPWAGLAVGLALLQAVESGLAAPWYLSVFHWPAGGPGGGDHLLNDSNVDWGQGLIALRDELKRRGVGRVYLAYQGTDDPAIYGIDYVPWLGGRLGSDSEWLAVSSYYLVGLSQRMMTPQGRTEAAIEIDCRPLWKRWPVARPADCMYLFRLGDGRPSR